eukprot:6487312-Amphidinium_carterae.1
MWRPVAYQMQEHKGAKQAVRELTYLYGSIVKDWRRQAISDASQELRVRHHVSHSYPQMKPDKTDFREEMT